MSFDIDRFNKPAKKKKKGNLITEIDRDYIIDRILNQVDFIFDRFYYDEMYIQYLFESEPTVFFELKSHLEVLSSLETCENKEQSKNILSTYQDVMFQNMHILSFQDMNRVKN